jgi:hypothetical protein
MGAPFVSFHLFTFRTPLINSSVDFTYSVHSSLAGSPVPIKGLFISPGGFIPNAAYTPCNFHNLVGCTLVETIMCIVSFYITYQLTRPRSHFTMRSALMNSPVASFTTFQLIGTQHATGFAVMVAIISR